MVENREIMTAAEVAEYLQLSEDHIRRMTSQRTIPHTKIGHAVRYELSAITEWLRGHRVRTRKEIVQVAEAHVAANMLDMQGRGSMKTLRR